LRGGALEVTKAFSSIAQTALAQGAAAVDRGATREEILETLSMAIYMGAGPAAMHASHALGAYAQFAAAKSAQAA
jgi:alkylhydroperoxidase/carboxymuconolactone decarboxylase family protein YurZ